MHEILFRGKRLDNGEWIEGHLLTVTLRGETAYLIFADSFKIVCGEVKASLHALVDPNTVGQYTGLKDKNGKRIFEGDIIKVSWHAPRRETVYEEYEVVYSKSGFFAKRNGKLLGQISNYISPNVNMRCEVIGNIHDNPEFLERGVENAPTVRQ